MKSVLPSVIRLRARCGWRRLSPLPWLALIGLVLAPSPAAAQQDAGSLRVLVQDSTQAVVPGATVELTNAGTGTTSATASDEAGYATFATLPRGT